MAGEQSGHQTVFLAEAIDALVTKTSGNYVDATFGRGGHSQLILNRLDQNGRLLAIDKDPEAVEFARKTIADERFQIQQGSFSDITQFVSAMQWEEGPSGILLDLGVSSPQLDSPHRGFSFMQEGPLDMRMDLNSTQTAATWLARVDEADMVQTFRDYGEERFAKRIAKHIVEARQTQTIATTQQLVEIIKQAVPFYERNKHPATRVFQAIRIVINDELNALDSCLKQAMHLLKVGGRLVVISFHSLEDRIVKRFFVEQSREKKIPKNLPVVNTQWQPTLKIISKQKPSENELQNNRRARSAMMRVAEKIA